MVTKPRTRVQNMNGNTPMRSSPILAAGNVAPHRIGVSRRITPISRRRLTEGRLREDRPSRDPQGWIRSMVTCISPTMRTGTAPASAPRPSPPLALVVMSNSPDSSDRTISPWSGSSQVVCSWTTSPRYSMLVGSPSISANPSPALSTCPPSSASSARSIVQSIGEVTSLSITAVRTEPRSSYRRNSFSAWTRISPSPNGTGWVRSRPHSSPGSTGSSGRNGKLCIPGSPPDPDGSVHPCPSASGTGWPSISRMPPSGPITMRVSTSAGGDSASGVGSIMASSSVHLAPAGDREHRPEVTHVLDLQRVGFERRQVRRGSRLQASLLLQVGQPGGADRAEANRLEPGHALAGVVVMLQGPDRQHRIERGDRRVGARPDLQPSGHRRAERVHGGGPALAQPSLVHAAGVPPRRVERRLDRDRQAQRAGPFDLLVRRHLEVLQAVPAGPEVPTLPGAQRAVHALPHPEGLLDGGVADHVEAGLETGQVGVVEELCQLVVLIRERPGPFRVGVRPRQRRGVGPDGAVQEQVAADAVLPEVPDDPRQVAVGHVDDEVEREVVGVAQQDLDVPPSALVRDCHLVG